MASKLTKEEWLGLVAEFEDRDITQEDFIQEKNVNLPTFRYWLYKTRRESQQQAIEAVGTNFVEVIQSQDLHRTPLRIQTEAMTPEFNTLPAPGWIAELIRRSSSRSFSC